MPGYVTGFSSSLGFLLATGPSLSAFKYAHVSLNLKQSRTTLHQPHISIQLLSNLSALSVSLPEGLSTRAASTSFFHWSLQFGIHPRQTSAVNSAKVSRDLQ